MESQTITAEENSEEIKNGDRILCDDSQPETRILPHNPEDDDIKKPFHSTRLKSTLPDQIGLISKEAAFQAVLNYLNANFQDLNTHIVVSKLDYL